MNDRSDNNAMRRRWIVVALVVLFLAPLAGSWLLFHFTPLGQGGGGASHGTLIEPPRQLPDRTLQPIDGGSETATLYGKWSLVYLVNSACDTACEQNLYRMRQLRLAQGKHGTRVQRILINFGRQPIRFSERLRREYAGQWILDPEG